MTRRFYTAYVRAGVVGGRRSFTAHCPMATAGAHCRWAPVCSASAALGPRWNEPDRSTALALDRALTRSSFRISMPPIGWRAG